MNLAVGVGEPVARLHERKLLSVDEGVRRAVELVVRKHAEGKCSADADVDGGQVAHALAQSREGARHELVVHAVGECLGGLHVVGPTGDAEEEGVGPLVAKQEGE